MPTYVTQVDVNQDEFQNSQDLVSNWATIRDEVENMGGELHETYAILGEYDFLVTFTVDSPETAFQVTQVIESHGLDTETMGALPLDRIGELVEDV